MSNPFIDIIEKKEEGKKIFVKDIQGLINL